MSTINSEVETCIRRKTPWSKLPPNVKQLLGQSQKEYEKAVVSFSIKNQLRYAGNLVKHVRRNEEKRYYEELLAYSVASLLLFPYHLSDIFVSGLRVTPFQYYCQVVESIMDAESSYDSLPNFTAADVLRLLGIGRNEYIDLMNQCRSSRKLFRKKHIKGLLPSRPIDIHIEPWWLVQVGFIVEDDMKIVSQAEKGMIDSLIDNKKPSPAGLLDRNLVLGLYKKGLIYLDVPIEENDQIVVPPLEGFVMNRVLGDYFETLLYKIFVSIDEHTSVGELANVLEIDVDLVKQAVSLYCRLGFARKKSSLNDMLSGKWHSTWNPATITAVVSPSSESGLNEFSKSINLEQQQSSPTRPKRIAFLFDSTLTAFLMMGNLSPGLKSHAVTMFEVGKLTDESIDSFLSELEKVSCVGDDSEGEARRYFEHALVLRSTILALRGALADSGDAGPLALDLVRCESLHSLDKATCARLLSKNYQLVVSMAPLSAEVVPIACRGLPHLGPPSPMAATPWWKLFLYTVAGDGPWSLLLPRGTKLTRLPSQMKNAVSALLVPWGHDPTLIPISNVLNSLNESLAHQPTLIQVYDDGFGPGEAETCLVPFPFSEKESEERWMSHPGVANLVNKLDLNESCGYLTLLRGCSISDNVSRSESFTVMSQAGICLGNQDLSRPRDLYLKPDNFSSLAAGTVSSSSSTSSLLVSETPTTPSCLHAWFETIAPGDAFSPVKEEEEEEPSNGITSQECQEMLQQEIDSLRPLPQRRTDEDEEEYDEVEDVDMMAVVVSNQGGVTESAGTASRATVAPTLHVELTSAVSGVSSPSIQSTGTAGTVPASWDPSQWKVLDCRFGVPLFDACVNRHVCRSIADKLSQPERLNKCVDAADSLVEKLSGFIASTQDWDENETIWWPTKTLELIKGGILQRWNGK